MRDRPTSPPPQLRHGRVRRAVVLLAPALLLTGACASRKTLARFTSDKVEQIRPGMTMGEVAALFGPPDAVEPHRGAGGAPGRKLIYHVGPQLTDVNVFVFALEGGEPRLRTWFLGRRPD